MAFKQSASKGSHDQPFTMPHDTQCPDLGNVFAPVRSAEQFKK